MYHGRHLERFPLGTPYPAIVEAVKGRMMSPLLRGAKLVIDATGVGRPVGDMFNAAGLHQIAVTIVGGDTNSYVDGMYRVPKRELVSVLQVLLQGARLKFAAELPDVPTLIRELLAFQVKITTAANDTYGAWRDGAHDDLVLAVALATWYAERVKPIPEPPKSRQTYRF